MMYKLEENKQGEYVDRDGTRYHVNECNAAYTPDGLNAGYTEFASEDEMMAAWSLTHPEEFHALIKKQIMHLK